MRENTAINNLRVLACDMITNAKSGHPGVALGATPICMAVQKVMNSSAKYTNHLLRDRFVLSCGHGSSMLYAMLHLLGYNISIDDLKNFRKIGSKTPGHPEVGVVDGVDVSTGPLGQGVANAVGLALAEKHLAAIFNKNDIKLFDNYTYCVLGDGCLMEGVANEALSFAGTNNLNKLIYLYDSNKITIDGSTDMTFSQDTKKVLEGYGFNVFEVEDGNSVSAIENAIKLAKLGNKPSFIIVKTKIGYGSVLEGSNKVHGTPLKEEELAQLRVNLGINTEPFGVLDETKEYFQDIASRKEVEYSAIANKLDLYKVKYPSDYKVLEEYLSGYANIDKVLEEISIDEEKSTRDLSGMVLNHLSKYYGNIIGGTADVSASSKAYIKEGGNFSDGNPQGRNIMFGIREHAMSAIANGVALYGGLKVFASTFFAFSDYMKNGIRMSALMDLPVTYILSHDSIAVGEDGPTHQCIEQLVQFRAMPNINVFRPCNIAEVKAAYRVALTDSKPTIMALSRQGVPPLHSTMQSALKGGYILSKEESNHIDVILIATGSEVQYAISAKEILKEKGYSVRVVSMPCVELFEAQSIKYKEEVLPNDVTNRVSIEAGSTLPWYKYIGLSGATIGVDTFGMSGSWKDLYNHFGFSPENVANIAIDVIKSNS